MLAICDRDRERMEAREHVVSAAIADEDVEMAVGMAELEGKVEMDFR